MTGQEPLFPNRASPVVRIGCTIFAIVAGGMVGREWAMSIPGRYGGKPVYLTTFGEAFFFVIGSIGTGCAVAVMLSMLRLHRPAWQVSFIGILLSVLLSCLAPLAGILALEFTFITIPHDFYAMLFDISAVEAARGDASP